MKLEKVDEHLNEKLRNPYFKELYELEQQKIKIVKHIINYRIKNKFNQQQLAKKAGVTQQHISKIEHGEFSNVSTLEKILLFIGYTVKMQAIPLSQNIKHQINRMSHSKEIVNYMR
jgi:transcriptional regulator with XRE-family HTH domain